MKKIILDCDPGMDDSAAIILAAKHPNLTLLAVTTVNGNYPVNVTFDNARKIMSLLGREDIPVYRGCPEPLVRPAPRDPFTHGSDGQAETNLPLPQGHGETKHAVNAIIELVHSHPGEITLLCTGPMTNLAAAMKLAPEIKQQLAGVIAISGAFGFNEASFVNATGDTPQSEWNVYVDPEAASLVYNSGTPLTVIGLDVATYFAVDFTREDMVRLSASSRLEANFLHTAIRFVRERGFGAY
ncbi:MAG: nucleoside hydrolase, partial [Clostridia bacterium]